MYKEKFTLGLVYEITENPLFGSSKESFFDRLTEFSNPSEINRLARSLRELGFSIVVIDGPKGLIADASNIKDQCDLLFNKSIGFRGLERKIAVPAICQLYNLPFIGSSAYAMTLARHKFHSNRLIHGLSVKVPNAVFVSPREVIDLSSLSFPVIVKPNHESDAIGIDQTSICVNSVSATKKIEWIHQQFSQGAVVEEYIRGEEWKIPVIGNSSNAKALGCVGVMRNGEPIIDSLQTREDVLCDTLSYYEPNKTALVDKAKNISVWLHNKFQLSDYSRFDFRLGENESLNCMEVSTHPDISADSSFITAALQSLPNYNTIVQSIVDAAFIRYGLQKRTP